MVQTHQDIQYPKFFPPGVVLPPLLTFICKITQNLKYVHAPVTRKSTYWALCIQGLMVHAAAADKSLQSCLILCDPVDGSPPGSLIPGILHTGTLEWIVISFSNAWKWKLKVKLLSSCLTLCDPMDCSPPGSSIHGIFQARVLEWGAIAFSENGRDNAKSERAWGFGTGKTATG